MEFDPIDISVYSEVDFTDDEIWQALKEVNLFDYISNMTEKLDTIVSDSNNLFSVG